MFVISLPFSNGLYSPLLQIIVKAAIGSWKKHTNIKAIRKMTTGMGLVQTVH